MLCSLSEETNTLLVFVTQTFTRGGDGKCTRCDKAEGDHFIYNGVKYCYVSTTSPCPPPHVYVFAILRLASTDTNVYYAHVRDAPGDLQPLRRHEQRVSSKKIYALYCNANLRLATNESVSLFDMCRR